MTSGGWFWNLVLGLHILFAAVWVGGIAFVVFAVRPSVAMLEPAPRSLVLNQLFGRFFRLVWHAMPLVLLSGYAMLFGAYGGFSGVGWNVHVMHLLGLIMAGIFLAIFFGPWASFRRTTDRNRAAAAAGTIRQLSLVNLVLGAITIVISALNN